MTRLSNICTLCMFYIYTFLVMKTIFMISLYTLFSIWTLLISQLSQNLLYLYLQKIITRMTGLNFSIYILHKVNSCPIKESSMSALLEGCCTENNVMVLQSAICICTWCTFLYTQIEIKGLLLHYLFKLQRKFQIFTVISVYVLVKQLNRLEYVYF